MLDALNEKLLQSGEEDLLRSHLPLVGISEAIVWAHQDQNELF
jgi:hypothetical protein